MNNVGKHESAFFDNITEIAENTEIISVPRAEYDTLVRRSALLDVLIASFQKYSSGYQYEKIVTVVAEMLAPQVLKTEEADSNAE